MKIFKRFSSAILMVVFTFFLFAVFSNTTVKAAYSGIGEKRFEWDREIYDGVNLRHTMSYNQNKDQKTYTITFNPKTTALKPVVTTGPGVFGGNVMSSLVNNYESKGEHVVFGVNGDGYDTSNGVPSGIGINNGILLNSSTNKLGWGITASGEVKYGNASLPMNFKINNGANNAIAHINKERKTSTSGIYLLTEDFGAYTNSTEAGVEVVLNVDAGQDGLRIGQDYNLTVEKIVTVSKNTNRNKTAIGKGKAVLATHSSSPQYNTLRNLAVGAKIKVRVDDNSDKNINWTEIVAGMGIFHMLLDNGVEHANLSNPDVHPRTAMGIKADGTIVLMQNDGRQIGWAAGFSFREMVEYMRDDLGCVTVFNFDGGGSSTIAATLPGDEKATILNRPSDGRERSNANAFLLIADKAPVSGKPVEKLHIYPSLKDNYATKGIILENGKLSFNVAGTDQNFYPVPLPGTVSFRVENEVGSIGTINSSGVFTATTGTGKGKVIASYGNLEAAFELEVTDTISKIERDITIITVAPLATQQLEFRALKDGVPIILSNESLNFSLSPSTLGTVSSSGVFSAANVHFGGNLKISYKSFEISIPVEVGAMPKMILDFEEDIFAKGWLKKYTNMPQNGGDGEISMNYNEDYIKHGDGSLRIDYDFKTDPLKGTVAIEIGQTNGTQLEGQPTHISAWVYGDGNGGWFRIQLTEGKYAGDVKIDWVGWKYIETEIPTDAPFPYVVQNAVRLLGTPTVANNTKGTIYVDSVRAIYDYRGDDNGDPIVNEASIYPKNGAVTADKQQSISLTVIDSTVDDKGVTTPATGINRARTQMFINGKEVDNLQQTVNQDGSVDIIFNPSALSQLANGKQNIKVRVEDNFGNKTFKEWSFTVSSTALSVVEVAPGESEMLAGESFNYQIKANNADSFTNFELIVNYNKDSLILNNFTAGSGVTIVSQNINANTGKATVVLSGMNGAGSGLIDVVDLNFTAKDRVSDHTSIYVEKAQVTAGGSTYEVNLNGYSVPLKQHYDLKAEGFTVGSTTIFTLTENGSPVAGAEVKVKEGSTDILISGLTDSKGQISTNLLTSKPIGTSYEVYAVKAGVYSNTLNISVMGSSGLVTAIEGASIRVKTENSAQGLRFTGKLSETAKNNAHGFYVVYGKTTIDDLYTAINNKVGNDIIINGKKVYEVSVPGVNSKNEFSVVLTGIPEAGYLDNVSVIAYVVDGGQQHFVEAPISRSVAEVALKMHAEDLGGSAIESILSSVSGVAKKLSYNALGQLEITNGLYETDHKELKKEFIKDWNAKFGTKFTDIVHADFNASAKTGTNDNSSPSNVIKNISNLNIYKFFNDPTYKDKWGWILDFIEEIDNTTHPTRQVVAIKGNGSNEDFLLYNAEHLIYALINFFNESNVKAYYTPLEFTNLSNYDKVKQFNKNIFAKGDVKLVQVGDVVIVPEAPKAMTGYTFDHFSIGGAQVQPGASYVVSVEGIFTPIFVADNYNIKYYDGGSELVNLAGTYNIETRVDLPTPEKSGFIFLGWYDNNALSGSVITNIATGSTGNKEFYAKWEEVSSGTYIIEYVLDGGELFDGYSTRNEMIEGFLTDFYNWLDLAGHLSKGSVSLMEFMHGAGKTSGFDGSYVSYHSHLHVNNEKGVNNSLGKFINQNGYNQKWTPLMNIFDQYLLAGQNVSFWASTYTAGLRFKGFISGVSTWPNNPTTVDLLAEIPAEYAKVTTAYSYTVDSETIILPKADKAGKAFAGWYDNPNFTGNAVTQITKGTTGNKKYYAKWS